MTKLKTLKDIDFQDYSTSRNRIKNKLRAEAVKWIKFEYEKWGIDQYCCKPAIKSWIKHFFNITEEDLK